VMPPQHGVCPARRGWFARRCAFDRLWLPFSVLRCCKQTAVFTPVVKLEVVEVKTHEEDEDIVYKQYVVLPPDAAPVALHQRLLTAMPSCVSRCRFSSIRVCRRAKLFTYSESMLDKGTGKKSWNEKGVGDMKLLK